MNAEHVQVSHACHSEYDPLPSRAFSQHMVHECTVETGDSGDW